MSPRSAAQQAAIRERSRRNLLESALELFARKGYHETTMEELAAAASVSKGLIYHYFPGKIELLTALIEHGFESFTDPKQLLEGMDSPSALALLLNEIMRSSQKSIRFWRLYFSLMMQPDVFEQATLLFRSYFQEMRELLSHLFEDMGYSQPDLEALYFAGVLDGILFHVMLDTGHYPLEEMRNFIVSRYNLPDLTERS